MRPATVTVIIVAVCTQYFVQAHPTRYANLQGSAFNKSVSLNCTREEHACLSKGLIPHASGKCYTPLERGPCSKGQRLVLDPKGVQGRRGRCAKQPCSSGASRFVPYGGRCLSLANAQKLLCRGGRLHLDATGSPRCGSFPGWGQALQQHVRCTPPKKIQLPVMNTDPHSFFSFRTASLPCAEQNNGNCMKLVTGHKPAPIIQAET